MTLQPRTKATTAAKQKKRAAIQATGGQTPVFKQASRKPTSSTASTAVSNSTAATPPLAQAVQSGKASSKPAPADPACPKAHVTKVAGDADVMLNQTNIGENNNKFYRMQLLQEGTSTIHWVWTRWGRVGDKGQTRLQGPFDAETGYKEFKKKFRCCHPFQSCRD